MSWTARRLPPPRVTSWPEYGSDAWYNMHPEHPAKRVAVLEAAERWRLQQLREQWLEELDDADWYAHVFGDARRVASQTIAATNRIRSFKEAKDERAKPRPAHVLKATPGWPPVAIPGRPGWRRHLVNGRQADCPDMQQENAA